MGSERAFSNFQVCKTELRVHSLQTYIVTQLQTLVIFLGERHGGQHQEHGQRHEHGAGEAEPDARQDQRQGRLRHPEGQDG